MSDSMVVEETFVRFFFPGTLRPEEDVSLVWSRDIKLLRIPERAFAFHFFNLYSLTHYVGEQLIMLTSQEEGISGTYFITANNVKWIEEALIRDVSHRRRLENLKAEGYRQVVKCVTGGYQGFAKGDCVIAPREVFAK